MRYDVEAEIVWVASLGATAIKMKSEISLDEQCSMCDTLATVKEIILYD